MQHTFNKYDAPFKTLQGLVAHRFGQMSHDIKGKKQYLYVSDVDTDEIKRVWYANFNTAAARQHHKCNACDQFIERFGNLVFVHPDGTAYSPFFAYHITGQEEYDLAMAQISNMFGEMTKVVQPFDSREKIWGQVNKKTGWDHFCVNQHHYNMFTRLDIEPHQWVAEKMQERDLILRALGEFPKMLVQKAVTMLEMDSLYRGDKVLGPAQHLLDAHNINDKRGNAPKAWNMMWKHVVESPAGFNHPRSSMIGTLLEDLQTGMDIDAAAKRFKDKMHPLQYLRPQAAPAAGNIAAGEKLVEKMGIAASLKRRFATLEDVNLLWKAEPVPVDKSSGVGVFGGVKAKSATVVEQRLPPQAITLRSFVEKVLSKPIRGMNVLLGTGRQNLGTVVGPADPTAPNIMRHSNPYSTYVYNGGSTPPQWNLSPGTAVRVTGVMGQPEEWNTLAGFKSRALFILEGARPTDGLGGGGMFPEMLKPELLQIRATIEAYTKSAVITGYRESTATGLFFAEGHPVVVDVQTMDGSWITYTIDRAD